MKLFITMLVHVAAWAIIYGIFALASWGIPQYWQALTIYLVGGLAFVVGHEVLRD